MFELVDVQVGIRLADASFFVPCQLDNDGASRLCADIWVIGGSMRLDGLDECGYRCREGSLRVSTRRALSLAI
jgi:hypothetical protein